MKNVTLVLALVVLVGGSSCARHVTVSPEIVRQKHSKQWTVKSEPEAGVTAGHADTPETTDPQIGP